jgi:hypothetical protein
MDYGNEYFHYTGIFSDHKTTGCCEYCYVIIFSLKKNLLQRPQEKT